MNTSELIPKNQHQLVLYYLINWKFPFSLKNVIDDSLFYKFQTRLSDIELRHESITTRKKVKFTNRFGRKSDYLLYQCNDVDKAIELFSKY